MRPGVGCAIIRFAIFLEVTGRSHAAAGQNSKPCQEEQDRFYDLLLAAVAALSDWALPEWHLGTETAQVLPLFGDGTSLAAEQAPFAGIRVRGTIPIFRLVKCFHLHSLNRFLCYVCKFCMP